MSTYEKDKRDLQDKLRREDPLTSSDEYLLRKYTNDAERLKKTNPAQYLRMVGEIQGIRTEGERLRIRLNWDKEQEKKKRA